MPTIIGISGSLRRGSFNTMLLRTAVEMAPAGTTIEIESIADVPFYDGDVEAEQGIPPSVQRLKDRIAAADGLLLVTPEYNGAMPGVMKNAIDWMSRPASDIGRVFRELPVGIIGASPGPGGSALAQVAWLSVLRILGCTAWFGGRFILARARDMFNAEGRLTDEALRGQLQKFVNGFAEFVEQHPRPKR
jgi:chromate reductase